MDFFGASTHAVFNTPVGALIQSATDPLHLSPDWGKNIEVCDAINTSKSESDSVKALYHLLSNSNQNVVQLTLVLCETCISNCPSLVPFIDKPFMASVASIAKGSSGFDNQDTALRLVQKWAKENASHAAFMETYNNLKFANAKFPADEAVPSKKNASKSQKQTSNKNDDTSRKLVEDLKVVLDKVRLCREMLPNSVGIVQDEALAEVIGFLEACADRLVDLIEAGSQGLLDEDVFEVCFRVNDAVVRTLNAEKNGTPIAVDDETTVPIELFQGKSSSTISNTGKADTSIKAVMNDEADEFDNLTLKPAKKKNTSGVKPIPIIKGPSGSVGAGKLLPPPSGSKAAGPSGTVDLLDLGVSESTTAKPPAPPNNSIDDIFGGPSVSAAANNASSSASMSDADFDAFLNNITVPNK